MNTAVEHHDDTVRHDHRLGLVVGYVDRGNAEILLQVTDKKPHLLA